MPIEIKELVIRAVAEKGRPDAVEGLEVSSPNDQRQAIVEACVKQVLRILKKAKER